ncbi:MAG TPA: heat-inducible transcriptional repressor HrcA [Anaerolineales bacterium]|nr:heat-inducible transcriptional repressor HrcA [Anaerolineales bacterium]
MSDLSERQKALLLVIIRDYIDAAQPVGSKRLVERYHLDLSSATIRHEMSALTEMGYLRQPHTSAGRVPTEEGYRLFVSEMMSQAVLPESVQNTISHQFLQARPGVDQWMHLAASVLAHQSQGVSMVTAPRLETIRFQHVELISTQGRQVLMVLVIAGGEVSQQLLTLAEPVSQERLSQTAQRLNTVLVGETVTELASMTGRADALEQDILTLVLAEMRRATESTSGEIYTDGLTNVLSEPEFAESDEARRALRIFEERSTLQDLLARTALNSTVGGLQVLIGGEGGWEELRQCSMVLARYGVPGLATGTLGVFGPMRMAYARTIPTVRFVAGLLSNLVNDQIAGQDQ